MHRFRSESSPHHECTRMLQCRIVRLPTIEHTQIRELTDIDKPSTIMDDVETTIDCKMWKIVQFFISPAISFSFSLILCFISFLPLPVVVEALI